MPSMLGSFGRELSDMGADEIMRHPEIRNAGMSINSVMDLEQLPNKSRLNTYDFGSDPVEFVQNIPKNSAELLERLFYGGKNTGRKILQSPAEQDWRREDDQDYLDRKYKSGS